MIQALDLNEKKLKIMEYVESRMSFIAPNLSQIVGPTVAAKLMGKFFFYVLSMSLFAKYILAVKPHCNGHPGAKLCWSLYNS